MDDITNVLNSYNYSAPHEVTLIKKYIQENFKENSTVQIKDKNFIITVNNASLANTLKLRQTDLMKNCNLKSAPQIRIGTI